MPFKDWNKERLMTIVAIASLIFTAIGAIAPMWESRILSNNKVQEQKKLLIKKAFFINNDTSNFETSLLPEIEKSLSKYYIGSRLSSLNKEESLKNKSISKFFLFFLNKGKSLKNKSISKFFLKNRNNDYIILGSPGVGKTSLLIDLVHKLAEKKQISYFVDLKEGQTAHKRINYVCNSKESNIILLVDALDEDPILRKQLLKKTSLQDRKDTILEYLYSLFQDCKIKTVSSIILTSRYSLLPQYQTLGEVSKNILRSNQSSKIFKQQPFNNKEAKKYINYRCKYDLKEKGSCNKAKRLQRILYKKEFQRNLNNGSEEEDSFLSLRPIILSNIHLLIQDDEIQSALKNRLHAFIAHELKDSLLLNNIYKIIIRESIEQQFREKQLPKILEQRKRVIDQSKEEKMINQVIDQQFDMAIELANKIYTNQIDYKFTQDEATKLLLTQSRAKEDIHNFLIGYKLLVGTSSSLQFSHRLLYDYLVAKSLIKYHQGKIHLNGQKEIMYFLLRELYDEDNHDYLQDLQELILTNNNLSRSYGQDNDINLLEKSNNLRSITSLDLSYNKLGNTNRHFADRFMISNPTKVEMIGAMRIRYPSLSLTNFPKIKDLRLKDNGFIIYHLAHLLSQEKASSLEHLDLTLNNLSSRKAYFDRYCDGDSPYHHPHHCNQKWVYTVYAKDIIDWTGFQNTQLFNFD